MFCMKTFLRFTGSATARFLSMGLPRQLQALIDCGLPTCFMERLVLQAKETQVFTAVPMMMYLTAQATKPLKRQAFCHAFSPANNTQFGIYGAIPNGNGYRVNYEVVSIIDGTKRSSVMF